MGGSAILPEIMFILVDSAGQDLCPVPVLSADAGSRTTFMYCSMTNGKGTEHNGFDFDAGRCNSCPISDQQFLFYIFNHSHDLYLTLNKCFS